jgi:tetrapyrrole methylase family protein/MazG family protein
MPKVTVVGLGPGGPDLLTEGTRAAAARIPVRYLRTSRHPSAPALGAATSFDEVYEAAATLDEVYAGIASRLLAAAGEHGEVLYAVPGSPRVAERSVELLAATAAGAGVDVEVLPALSFLDLAWVRLGVDPLAAGARVVDGHRFAVEAAGSVGPLLVGQCDSADVLSEVKLALDLDDHPGPGPVVTVLHHLGLADEVVAEVPWAELDRAVRPDHLTSLWIPELAAPVAGELARFAELVRTLRERCPWDREQTHQTLTRHLLEETYEVLEAIAALPADPDADGAPAADAHLEEELGDLLFQVVFHATLGAERGAFTLADVARGIHDKLVHRHPHVFGAVDAATADEVVTNWEQIKKAEKGRASLMDGIPGDLPSLLHAHKVQRKAASVGLDPTPAGGGAGTGGAPADADAVGAALFAVVAAARRADVDPEAALRGTTARFRDRFLAVERRADERGIDLAAAAADADVVEALWSEAARD